MIYAFIYRLRQLLNFNDRQDWTFIYKKNTFNEWNESTFKNTIVLIKKIFQNLIKIFHFKFAHKKLYQTKTTMIPDKSHTSQQNIWNFSLVLEMVHISASVPLRL